MSASQCFTCVLFHLLQALLLLQLLGWVFVPVYIACGVSQLLFGSLVRNETSRDVAQLVERRTGTPLTQVRFPGAARDFSPRVNFRCRLSYGVSVHTPCSIACINICAHVKDPVVHV